MKNEKLRMNNGNKQRGGAFECQSLAFWRSVDEKQIFFFEDFSLFIVNF